MSSVLSFLPRLHPEDLVAFTQYCFFDPDASSFRALELAQLRYDLLHAILSALANTDVPELTLFSRLQDAVAVTLTLHTDFFETHVAEPLEEQVSAAFAQGMALSQIEAAVRLLQRSYGTTTEDVMIQLTLRFVEETLEEAVKEEENKEKSEEKVRQARGVSPRESSHCWRSSRRRPTSLALSKNFSTCAFQTKLTPISRSRFFASSFPPTPRLSKNSSPSWFKALPSQRPSPSTPPFERWRVLSNSWDPPPCTTPSYPRRQWRRCCRGATLTRVW